ncbi:MAG: hypothetical protein RLZZ86_125 [Cyanobacteriota bacterium]|jgi:hypothetical protein
MSIAIESAKKAESVQIGIQLVSHSYHQHRILYPEISVRLLRLFRMSR